MYLAIMVKLHSVYLNYINMIIRHQIESVYCYNSILDYFLRVNTDVHCVTNKIMINIEKSIQYLS